MKIHTGAVSAAILHCMEINKYTLQFTNPLDQLSKLIVQSIL